MNNQIMKPRQSEHRICLLRFSSLLGFLLLVLSTAVSAQNLSASLSYQPVPCEGGQTSLIVTATGGQTPYEYSIDGVNYVSVGLFNNVSAGTYSQISVRDAGNNVFTLSTAVIDDGPSGPPVNYYVDNDGDEFGAGTAIPLCYDPGAGFTTVNGDCNDASDQIAPGQAEVCNNLDDDCNGAIDNGLFFEDFYLDADFDSYGTGPALSRCEDPGIGYATNNVDCNDAIASINPGATEFCNGIDDNCNGLVDTSDPLLSPLGMLTVSAVANPISCNGGTSSVTLTPQGGVAPYTYGTQATQNLSAGAYTFTVTDANGCAVQTSVQITEPSPIQTTITNSPILCYGQSSVVTVTATGGIGPYTGIGTFIKSAGNHTFVVNDANGCTSTNVIQISQPDVLLASTANPPIPCFGGSTPVTVSASGGVAPYTGTGVFTEQLGIHYYTVTDANGCTDNVQLILQEPSALQVLTSYTPIAIAGQSTTVTVTAAGGTAPYTGTGNYTQFSGTQTYSVTDARGCIASSSLTLTEPNQLRASAQVGNISCAGGSTTLQITATGGVPPYSNTGTSIVTAGPYSVLVTDAAGAGFTVTGTVIEPADLIASAIYQPVLCKGASTQVSVFAVGGTPPYTGTGNFSRVAGTWTFTVTDANGCSAIASLNIPDAPAIQASASVITPIACFGGQAQVMVSASGGAGNFNGTGVFSSPAGTAVYTVTDGNGCTQQAPVLVSQPMPVQLDAQTTDVLCRGVSSGIIDLLPSGGTPPYTYSWDNGATSQDINGLQAGAYSVLVTDQNACTAVSTLQITEPDPFPAIAGILGTKTACVAYGAGSAVFSVNPISDGVNTTVYSWTPPSGMTVTSGQGTSTVTLSWSAAAVDATITGQLSVAATNGCVVANKNESVNYGIASPVTPATISGPARLCPNDAGTFSIASVYRASSYIWTVPAGMSIIAGAGTNVISVTTDVNFAGGNVSVQALNSCGSSPLRTRTTALNAPVSPGAITGASTGLCGASGVVYSISAVTGASSYVWTVPAGASIISGQGTTSITVNYGTSGGQIKVKSANNCGESAERTLTVSTSPNRPDPIVANPSGSLCQGSLTVYSVPTVPGASSYNWVVSSGGSIQGGQGSKSIAVQWATNIAGTVQFLTVRSLNSCGQSTTRSFQATATNCIRMDDGLEEATLGMCVYPNPSNGMVIVRFNAEGTSPFRIRCIDTGGRLIIQKQGISLSGENHVGFEIAGGTGGVYIIELEHAGRIVRKRLMVE